MSRFRSLAILLSLILLIGVTLLLAGQLAVRQSSGPGGTDVVFTQRPPPTVRRATPSVLVAPLDPAIIKVLQQGPANKPFNVLPYLQPVGVYLPGSAPQALLASQTPVPTASFTPTSTLEVITATPIPTLTPSLTLTPSVTFTPTRTITPSRTPTRGPSPTPQPTPTVVVTRTPIIDLGIIDPNNPQQPIPRDAGIGQMTPGTGDIPQNCAPKGQPVEGILTQQFWQWHSGIDLGVPIGTPVLATQSGQVIFAGWSDIGYGWLVIIQNGPYITYYAHNSVLNVIQFQYVHAGDIISFSGSTGHSSGPHVHYETRINDIPVDPLTFDSRGLGTC